MQECVNNEDYDEKEKTVDNINEDVIHRDITENEKETNWVTLEKLIEEFPYDTSPVQMEEGVNDEVGDENRLYLIE